MDSFLNSAMESMFDPEQTTAKLLDEVKANVASNVNTVDAAASLENQLSEEAAKFNACLTTMSNAIRKCEKGEISREEMLAECAPCVSALKNNCVALSLSGVNTTGEDITEDEIAMLREYIVGCKDIVAKRKEELQGCPTCESVGILEGLSNYGIATEASLVDAIRKSNESKTANNLYKQAKKLYSLGSKDKALKYINDAQKLFESCLKKIQKAGKMHSVERTTMQLFGTGAIADKENKQVTDNFSAAYVIKYYEDRIDSCKALKLQWTNKAGNRSYKETKAMLKAERKEEFKAMRMRNAKKAAGKYAEIGAKMRSKKAARKAMKGATECMIDFDYDLMYATEAYADEIFAEYEFSSALEAEGADMSSGPSPAEQKLQELYVQFNQAKANGDVAKMEQLNSEISRTLGVINKEASDAYNEEDLKAADRKIIKGLAVAAAIAGSAIIAKKTGIVGKIKEQTDKLRKNKGANKSETAKGNGLLRAASSSLKELRGKFKPVFKKKSVASATDMETGETVTGTVESMLGESVYSFTSSLESYMDNLELELSISSALEADGMDSESDPSPSKIGSKLRSGFAKLRIGKKNNDKSKMNEGLNEINEASNELKDADNAADTPDKKDKVKKAAKIGLAALAAAAIAVGGKKLLTLGKKAKQSATSSNPQISNVPALINSGANAIISVDSYIPSGSVLASLAFGLEGCKTTEGCGKACEIDDEDIDGKSFDDDDMMDDAYESDLDDLASEAAIAVMLAEDGIDDSDLI